jgi:hypothetical protein
MMTLGAAPIDEPFTMELRVDRIGSVLARVHRPPDVEEPQVVVAPAQRT